MPDDVQVVRHTDRVVIDIEHSSFGHEPVNFQTYRRSTQWHEVMIAGPVASGTGRSGNSFPGMYYYHPTQRTQWVVMVDGPVDWRECRLGVAPRNGALELGLFSTGTISPDAKLKVWHSELGDVPSQWQALETLVTTSFQLSPMPKPSGATPDWVKLASQCLTGLRSPHAMHPLARQLGGVAYRSMLDEYQNIYARPKAEIELICQASIARALHRAAQYMPLDGGAAISQRLTEGVIPHFFNSKVGLFENAYSGETAKRWARPKHAVLETWYALSNLSDVLYLGAAFPHDKSIHRQAGEAVSTWLAIGRDIGHVFPLFLDVVTRESQGGKLNVAVGGLYAAVMLSAAKLLPQRADELKAEAAQALTVLHRFPLQQMFHQPEMLAQAAESAFLLGAEDRSYDRMGEDFLHALLLMQYRDAVNGGLFEGCAGMMYPTFRESVASLLTLASVGHRVSQLPVRDICESGVARCYRFLKNYGTDAVFPAEGLATREVPEGANVGTAIYAAGGVFDLAYLQKTLK
jgi:hypothetical protein